MSNKVKLKTPKRILKVMFHIDKFIDETPYKSVKAQMSGQKIDFKRELPRLIIGNKSFKYFEMFIQGYYEELQEEPWVCLNAARQGHVNYIYRDYAVCLKRPKMAQSHSRIIQ